MNLKIVFMGTPKFAVPILEALIENYDVVGVVTQPDKMVGRKKELKASPIKEVALNNNIKVIQPNKIKEEYKEILDLSPDIIITCAYGQIVPNEILEFPKHKCINVHASLLPKYRGGAPIHRAIYNGDSETGITIMYMEEKMDAGDIIAKESIPIEIEDTVEIMHNKLSDLGTRLLLETLPKLINNEIIPEKQDESRVTYAWNIQREEEKLDFNKSNIEVYNHIRSFNSWPGTYLEIDDNIIKVWKAEIEEKKYKGKPGEIVFSNKDEIVIKCKEGSVKLKEIQPTGKNKMNIADYMNGKGSEVFKVGKRCK